MALDQLKVSITLKEIHCSDEADGSGNAEPFLWVVYFKVDGDSVYVGDDLKLHGSATVVGSPGSHGNLGGSVDAGQTVPIPSSIGTFKTTLRPIPTPFKGATVGGLLGMLVILLEEDSTSDHDIQVGHAALNNAVLKGINNIIKTLGLSKQDVTEADIAKLEKSISTAVENAIKDEVDLFQGIWSYVGLGNGQDDMIGTGKFVAKHTELAKKVGKTQPLKWIWNNEGKWALKGSMTVGKTAAAAIMRTGTWASKFVFGRTGPQFAGTNQSLFDKKGMRLLQMETWVENGVRMWSGVFRSGDWSHVLTMDRDTPTFLNETQDLFDKHGLRLEHMVCYLDGGKRRWAGSYRSGNWGHRLVIDRDSRKFASETQELFDQKGLRLEQMITYKDGGKRLWAGIYRTGNWGHVFTMDRTTEQFVKETQDLFDNNGLRLIDVERYELNGKPRWAGVYRTGDWGHRFIIDRGVESLLDETQKLFKKDKLRLTGVDVYEL